MLFVHCVLYPNCSKKCAVKCLEAIHPYGAVWVVVAGWWYPLRSVRSVFWDHFNLHIYRTTTAVTMINGGIKENVVPQTAKAYGMPHHTLRGTVRRHFRLLYAQPAM